MSAFRKIGMHLSSLHKKINAAINNAPKQKTGFLKKEVAQDEHRMP
jgi:hypothetical protein